MKIKLLSALSTAFLAATSAAYAVPVGTPAPGWSIPFAAIGGTAYLSLAQRMGWRLTPQDFGAKGNALSFADGAVSAGSSAFSSALATFSASDVGKTIAIYGAGASGAPLVTTISSFADAHDVVLGGAAATAVSGATYTYGADDSAAFAAEINAANAAAASGRPFCLSLPAGNYFINSTPLPAFKQNVGGGLCGAGAWKTVITLGPSYGGDLFAWSDSWGAGVGNAGGSQVIANTKYGVRVQGLTILGNRSAPALQNALMFYDHEDFVVVDDVDVEDLNGHALAAGVMKNDTDAYLRESHISNFRAFSSGSSSAPVFEIVTQCSSNCSSVDGSNTIDMHDIDIYAPQGTGLLLRDEVAGGLSNIRGIHMARIRLEGQENNPNNVNADLIHIGDSGYGGLTTAITCMDCVTLSPYANNFAVNIGGQSATKTMGIVYDGTIGGGTAAGGGVNIGAGSNIRIHVPGAIGSTGPNVKIASSATVAAPIVVNANGNEAYLTYSIDSTSTQFVTNGGSYNGGPPATAYIAPMPAINNYTTGNAHGALSVDWQLALFNLTQTASGSFSTISGGENNTASNSGATVGGGSTNAATSWMGTVSGGDTNTASGSESTVIGGGSNLANGTESTILGGRNGSTQGWYGAQAYSAGQFSVQGDAEWFRNLYRANTSGTTAVTLTSDGSMTVNWQNILSIVRGSTVQFDLSCVYRDTTNSKSQSWKWLGILMTRDQFDTTTLAAPAATNGQNVGAPGAATPTFTTPSTGQFVISFTAPNSDASHILCQAEGNYVQ